METPFEFNITVIVDGQEENHTCSVAADTLSSALDQSIDEIVKQEPKALFKGLTYFFCPTSDDPPTFQY